MPSDAPVQPLDWQRMFLGDLPLLFTLEVIVRTIIMYVYTLLLVRWLSRRAVGQLSLVEFLLVIALGSAVGDPMFYHDVPLLPTCKNCQSPLWTDAVQTVQSEE